MDWLDMLPELLENGIFVKKKGLFHDRTDNLKRFYYSRIQINEQQFYVNIGESDYINRLGVVKHKRFVYSITNNLPVE